MKASLKKNISLIAVLVAVLITVYFIILFISLFYGTTMEIPLQHAGSQKGWVTPGGPESDTAFGGIFISNRANDSLPYREYKRIDDSIKLIKQKKEMVNQNPPAEMSGMGNIGVASIEVMDYFSVVDSARNLPWIIALHDSAENLRNRISKLSEKDSADLAEQKADSIEWLYNRELNKMADSLRARQGHLYFLSLAEYTTDRDSRFYISNGKYYLAHIKWDTVVQNGKDTAITGHYIRKPLSVRYLANDKIVLIPISKKSFKSLEIVFKVLLFLGIFLPAYVFIGLPLHVLLSISRGNAFTEKNVRAFHIMALFLAMIAVLKVIMPYLMHFIYRDLIPADFSLPSAGTALWKNSYLFLIALALFIIGIAFKKGLRLQQDQELTV